MRYPTLSELPPVLALNLGFHITLLIGAVCYLVAATLAATHDTQPRHRAMIVRTNLVVQYCQRFLHPRRCPRLQGHSGLDVRQHV